MLPPMRESLKFITWPAIAGLLAALLILERWEEPGTGVGGDNSGGAVSYADAVATATPSVVNI